MRRLKVLWLSNKVQSGQDRGNTGTWLDAMAHGLVQSDQVELANIAPGATRSIVRQDVEGIAQWIIPVGTLSHLRNGLPPRSIVAGVCQAIEEFSPDLVHTWGTESFWGLLFARNLIQHPTLLEMQGVKGAIARVFDGGLTWQEKIATIGLKEIIRRNTVFQSRQRFVSWATFEREIIAGQRFVTVQSPWLEAQIRAVNPVCEIFRNDFALRQPFISPPPWQFTERPIIFSSASYPSPFKGIHIAVRTLAVLKRRFPDVQLRMAGALQRPGLRQEGYMAWVNREAKRLGVESNLHWLGPLTAEQIATEMQRCALVFLPTFIEGYCLALAEAMAVGVPTVVAYVGGAAHLAQDEESALYFSPGDIEMAAYQVGRLLTDRALAERLGNRAHEVALARNDPERIIQRQLDIYHTVLASTSARI